MSSWRSLLFGTVSSAEKKLDKLKLKARSLKGSRKPLTIQPYIGHTNGNVLYLRGRVLLDNNIRPPKEEDGIWQNIKNTYKRFESDEIPGARVRATLNDAEQEVVCDDEGFFRVELEPEQGIPREEFWRQVKLSVVETPLPDLSVEDADAEGRVIVPPTDAQFGVISDLDDTVMRTDVLNVLKMIRNTFLRNAYSRLPFEGVAAFYHALHAGTRPAQNPIFYVSSSPWNLYDFIIDFYKIRGIPLGPVFLRDLGISPAGIGGAGHSGHKTGYIQMLLDTYESLPFILIGDSGQKDAKIYKQIVQENPGRIAAIYIRDVGKVKLGNAVESIAEDVRKLGTDMLLVKDTVAAAEHAAANGYISPAALDEIRAARAVDEKHASFFERVVEEN